MLDDNVHVAPRKGDSLPLLADNRSGARVAGRTQARDKELLISMDRVLSTHVIANHRLTTAWLNRVAGAGIAAVEIFCAPQHLDCRDKSQIAELGHWFRDS